MQNKLKNNAVDANKLIKLRNTLFDALKRHDEIMSLISNETLRKTLLGLEQLNYQYLRELNAQIEILGGKPLKLIFNKNKEFAFLTDLSRKAKDEIEKKAVRIYTQIGKTSVQLYNKILKSPIANDNTRKMIRYQRNSIMCANQQLKLLTQFIHK